MKKVRALALTKGSIEEKQVIADYGNLAEEFWWELYIYFKIQELMKRRIAPSNKPDSRLENDPLKELAEMEKWFLMVGTAFRDNDSKFFKTLAKIAKFLSKGESNDLLAKRVLAAYAQCKSAGLKSISSSNLIKVLDELSPLPDNRVYDDGEIRRVMRAIGLKGTVKKP